MMDTIDEAPREGTAMEEPVLAIMADPKDANGSLLMLADAELNQSSVTLAGRNANNTSSFEQSQSKSTIMNGSIYITQQQ